MGGSQSVRSGLEWAIGYSSDAKPTHQVAKKVLLKVVLIGEAGVGKTSAMNRFVSNEFPMRQYKTTLCIDFLTKEVHTDRFAENGRATLQIWDTAGQERFQGLGAAFYRGADAVMFVYDVNKRDTFDALDTWYNDFCSAIQHSTDDGRSPAVVLLGNKIDLGQRQVSYDEGEQWASAHGGSYHEVSVKNGREGLDEAFQCCVDGPGQLPPK